MFRFVGLFLLAVTPPMSQAIEEPTYGVVRQIGDRIELRRYAAYAVAEVMLDTTATATATAAGTQAFPILAGYIFG